MPAGRPTKYKARKHPEMLERILSAGKYMETFCAEAGIHPDTFYEWKARYPKFSDALKRGRAIGKTLFLEKISAAAWDTDKHKVNNGLIALLAVNCYGMVTGKEKKDDKDNNKKSPKLNITVIK